MAAQGKSGSQRKAYSYRNVLAGSTNISKSPPYHIVLECLLVLPVCFQTHSMLLAFLGELQPVA